MMSVNEGLVSIIIPTHNRADLIRESLDSVFAQTYRNYEIIVVDDGSTDNTASVLQALIEQGVIRYIYQQKQGVSAARNRGIAEAKGRYVAFLDSDDLFDPQKLDIQVKYLQDHPEVGLVHSGFTKFDNTGHDLGYRNSAWFSGEIYPQILSYWTTLIAVDTVLVFKNVLDSIGSFDTTLRIGEDLDLWRRIARKYPFGFVNQSLARIRVHAGNTSVDMDNATREFERYLAKAFDDDRSLSPQLKCRALSRMYSNQAYMMLGGEQEELIPAAKINAKCAIRYDLLNLHGYIAFFSTALGYRNRKMLAHRWRLLRSWLMSRKRAG